MKVAQLHSGYSCGGLAGALEPAWLVELVGMLTLPLQFHLAHHRSQSLLVERDKTRRMLAQQELTEVEAKVAVMEALLVAVEAEGQLSR